MLLLLLLLKLSDATAVLLLLPSLLPHVETCRHAAAAAAGDISVE